MRYSYILPAFASLAFALPQDIDLDMVIAAPDPTYTTSVGLTAQVVTYDTTSILAEASAAASSISIAVDNVASTTVDVAATAEATADAKVKRAACDPQPTGFAAYALSSDTAADFRANGSWASIASAQPVPTGYARTQLNANGANSAYGYLGYYTLPNGYDSNACAKICTNTLGCMSFNIYIERDPSVDPGTGCTNPSSVVNAKCALWGSPLSSDSATNTGQMRSGFEVAIAGSNAYQNNSLIVPAGFSMGDTLNNAAINAPYDGQGYNTYMGATIFTKGTFSIQACADYCTAQTAYNVKHPASDGIPPKICNFFNTYMLYLNNASTPQGQYCSLYTESWDSSYATNKGQYRGSDYYFVRYSYTFKNATSVSPSQQIGDQKGAIYQARQDMTYYPSSLTSAFLPFCTSFLGYSAPVTTVTPVTTATPLVSSTVFATSTVTNAVVKRAASSLSTPAVLTKYPTGVISGACSLIAKVPTQTSTLTAATSTVTASTATTLLTVTKTVYGTTDPTSNGFRFQVSRSKTKADNKYVAVYGDGSSSLVSNPDDAAIFIIDESTKRMIVQSGIAAGRVLARDAAVEAEMPLYFAPQSSSTQAFTCDVDGNGGVGCGIVGVVCDVDDYNTVRLLTTGEWPATCPWVLWSAIAV